MKKTLKLDTYLTGDGKLEIESTVLRDYYKKLSKGEIKKDKETKVKLNLVLYPDFFYKSDSGDPVNAAVVTETGHEMAARMQRTTTDVIKILHDSQGSIKDADLLKKVSRISKR